MTITFIGHACFLIVSAGGTAILIDPYTASERFAYAPVSNLCDIVLVTHEHGDHNAITGLPGAPVVLRASATAKGIQFHVTPAFHDATGGSQRGADRIFSFSVDGVRLCHVGDLGAPLADAQIASIGPVDVLMVPVGGYYTIDAAAAWQVVDRLKPRVVLPMHYKTEKIQAPIAPLDGFLEGGRNIRREKTPTLKLTPETLPAEQTVVVLPMANG